MFLFSFLPIVLAVYYIVPSPFRNLILFLSSLFFYAWGEPKYILIMLFSTIVDYIHGLLIEYFKEKDNLKNAKIVLISSIIINLSILCFFKYSNFFISNLNNIFNLNIKLLNIALPIGISFYTFQTMSYSLDVYRGIVRAQKNIISFGAYVTLFPQLIAGPIVQYKTIADELDCRKESSNQIAYGINRFVIGLGKKVLLANSLGYIWSQISSENITELAVLSAWIGIIMFSLQIYFDFSGYSDMAIGLGNMFGFTFNENFNYPYESKSITEFWRRWHISLGSWFKEYVYIPLGGNKKNQIRNICIVWCITGLWHGASWNFVLWGVYFGVILLIEKLVLNKFIKVNSRIYTLILVCIGWVIFSFDNLFEGISYLKSMFFLNGNVLIDNSSLYIVYSNILLILIGILAATSIPKRVVQHFLKEKENSLGIDLIHSLFLLIILTLSTAYLVNSTYNPFLYFRF